MRYGNKYLLFLGIRNASTKDTGELATRLFQFVDADDMPQDETIAGMQLAGRSPAESRLKLRESDGAG